MTPIATEITIADITKGPFNLLEVLRKNDVDGVSTSAAAGISLMKYAEKVSRLSLQADHTNGATNILIGGSDLDANKTGVLLEAGDQFEQDASGNDALVALRDYWFNATVNGGKINVAAYYA